MPGKIKRWTPNTRAKKRTIELWGRRSDLGHHTESDAGKNSQRQGRVVLRINSRCLLSGVERKCAKGSRLRDRSADLEHCFLREPSNKVGKAGREKS